MNIGIIGLGRMGKNLLRTLHHIKEYNAAAASIDTIYIYDINIKVLEELSKLYSVKLCSNIEQLRDAVDAIIIATPTITHFAIANYFLEKSIDIFMEKPITSTIGEAQAIIENINSKNNICMVGHVERFNPAVLYLKEYLKDKTILSLSADRICKAEKGRFFDVDAVRDLMIHDIDIILSMIDCKINKLAAVSNSKDLNDVFAILQFENNVTANLTVNRLAHEKSRKLRINTDEEAIHMDFIKRKIDFHKPYPRKALAIQEYDHQIIDIKETIYFEGDSLKNELIYFINCIETRTKPSCNEYTAALALDVADQIVKSATEMR